MLPPPADTEGGAPDTSPAHRATQRVQLIGCGALVRELRAVLHADLGIAATYLPAPFHNRPDRIVPAIDELVASLPASIEHVLIGYGDCGTGGDLDRAIERWRSSHPEVAFSRLPGDHCYEFFTGSDPLDGTTFTELHGDEIGTFFLTDYLARHFELLIWHGLGLADHPDLLPLYFGNYPRLVHLAQSDHPDTAAELDTMARAAAERLGLRFERHTTGLRPFARAVEVALESSRTDTSPAGVR